MSDMDKKVLFSTENSEYRNRAIDLFKIVAMFGVICLHSTSTYLGERSFFVADVMYRSAVVSVPLFFMVSGFLLLGKKGTDLHYSLIKIIRIFRYVAITVVLYWLVLTIKKWCVDGDLKIDILLPLKCNSVKAVSFDNGDISDISLNDKNKLVKPLKL